MRHLGRRIGAISLGVILTAAHSRSADESRGKELASEKARISYSLGRKAGATIEEQKLDVELDPFMRGIRDVLTGAESPLTDEEMREVLETVRSDRMRREREEREALAAQNLKAGREFLAENARKDGVVVLTSGLQYRILQSGKGEQPGVNDKVSIHYRATLVDGTQIGSTYGREVPFSFRLETAIPGHLEALQLMRAGDKWRLFIPTELAYGEQGRPGLIGPNETLIFDVELLSVAGAESKPALAPAKPVESAAEASN